MPAAHAIRVGVAGWSYEDWIGPVYPAPLPRSVDTLAYLAACLDCIEINSTFYRPPSPAAAASWVRRTEALPNFTFTVKLWQRFTHERAAENFDRDVGRVLEGVAPLAEAGKCGALLVQFPWSFKRTQENAAWLKRVAEAFSDLRPVVEVRHDSWNRASVLDWLERHHVGVVAIDQPLFAHSIAPQALHTGPVGYVRLHGRNRENWFREDAATFERYDYLYSEEELDPWIARIREIAGDSAETFAITNNHYRGQAVVNALQIRAALLGESVAAPDVLRQAYPQLERITHPSPFASSADHIDELFD